MSLTKQELERQAEELYQRYGKPLERDHWGQYVAISPQGQTVIDHELLRVCDRAHERFGPGNFLFKIGDVVVGKWR